MAKVNIAFNHKVYRTFCTGKEIPYVKNQMNYKAAFRSAPMC